MTSIGYIFSGQIRGGTVSHRVQNIIIRDFSKKHDLSYKLSATESNLGDQLMVLKSLLGTYDSILMYSLYIILECSHKFNLVRDYLFDGGRICFCAEDIIYDKDNIDELINIYQLTKEQRKCGEIENSLYVFKDIKSR